MNNAKAHIINILRRIDDWITDRSGPVKVLFVVRNEIGFANQAPVLREMLKYPEFLIRTTSDGDNPTFNFNDPELQSLYDAHEIPADLAVFMKWHYLITTDILNLYFRRDALHVTIGHGCGFGNGYRKSDWITKQITQPCTNLVFGMAQALRAFVESTHPNSFDPRHRLFFETGFPKLDSLYNGLYSRQKTLEELGLASDKKTILIASHWGEFSKLRRWGETLLEALLPLQAKYNIILTSHPKLWELPETPKFSPVELWSSLKEIEAREKNVRIVKSGNPLHLLNAADLLISGNSSIRVEYSVFDRPALFYKPPSQRFTSSKVQELYEKGSYTFSSLDGLPELALKALKHPEALKEDRQILKNYFLANPGKSAAVMADLIRKIGRVSSPKSPNWKKAQELSREFQIN